MYDSLFKLVQKKQKIEQLQKVREEELNYKVGKLVKKNEEKMVKAAEIKKANYRIKLQALKKNINKTNFASEAQRQQDKEVLMKKVALKLRFEELEDFKRERDEASQAEKYRIIEKHINLDRTAQRKYPPYKLNSLQIS